MSRRVSVVGPGRAGGSFAIALESVGWSVGQVIGRGANLTALAADVDLVLVCTPDAEIAAVAAAIEPGRAVVAHVAGSLGLGVLARHRRRAAVHPLVALTDPVNGAARLRAECWFGVAGDPIVNELVAAVRGRSFEVADEHRARYHAAACVASNHVVALLGQVERLAAGIDVPSEAYLALTRASVESVATLGASAALTGPAARGDVATIDRHLDAMPAHERALYRALVDEARRLAGHADRFDDR